MAAYTWPASLPQVPQKGFSETGGALVLRTPTDTGPAKLRYRGKRPQILDLTFFMDTTDIETLDGFIKNTLHGVHRFNFLHPRTSASVEVRIIPGSGGELYTMSNIAPGYYNVKMQFEVLP